VRIEASHRRSIATRIRNSRTLLQRGRQERKIGRFAHQVLCDPPRFPQPGFGWDKPWQRLVPRPLSKRSVIGTLEAHCLPRNQRDQAVRSFSDVRHLPSAIRQ
jgi:hypothetical protein